MVSFDCSSRDSHFPVVAPFEVQPLIHLFSTHSFCSLPDQHTAHGRAEHVVTPWAGDDVLRGAGTGLRASGAAPRAPGRHAGHVPDCADRACHVQLQCATCSTMPCHALLSLRGSVKFLCAVCWSGCWFFFFFAKEKILPCMEKKLTFNIRCLLVEARGWGG